MGNQTSGERRRSMEGGSGDVSGDLDRLAELLGANASRSLAHLRRARITEVEHGDEDKDVDTEKADDGSDSDPSSSDDSESESETAGAASANDTTETIGVIESVAGTLKQDGGSLNDKMLSMIYLQKSILQLKDGKRKHVGKHIFSAGLVEIWTVLVKKIAGGERSAQDEETTKWKIMDIIYQLLVKISDKSNSFSKQLASEDLLGLTIDILKKQQHKQLCLKEPCTSATSWMIELLGNCYDDLEEDSKRELCRNIVDSYVQVECTPVQIKAGQTKMVIALKDQLKQRLTEADSQSADGDGSGEGGNDSRVESLNRAFAALLENLTDASPEKAQEKEAEHLYRIGMPRVFTENIKGWFKDSDKWRAFNENGKMWKCVQEWFKSLLTNSKVSTSFCGAACEAGIVEVMQGLLDNTQVQEAYMRNGKTQEVVAACLLFLLYVVQLKNGRKFLQDANIQGPLQYYLGSKDINIRGLSFLIISNMAKWDNALSKLSVSFSTSDVKLFLATYMAYKSEGEVMGDFLAKTNFPELCVQEFRNYVTREHGDEVLQDEDWEALHQLLGAMHIFSSRSDKFAICLVKSNIVEPIQAAMSSPYYQARQQEENCKQMLLVSILLIHNCVRLPNPEIKRHFLVPNLWQHIYQYSILRDTDNHKHFASFLAYTHMYSLCSSAEDMPNKITKFPKLDRAHTDIKYIHRLWHSTKEAEEKILGDYLAATGGAAVHVALLGELVEDMNSLGGKKEKTKPLLANMNNLSLESSAFAEELCRNGLLGHLKKIVLQEGIDLANIKGSEKEVFDHAIFTIHACAQYKPNMPYFRTEKLGGALCKLMMSDIPTDMRRRAVKAVVFLRGHDPELVDPHIAQHRTSALTAKELAFYGELYHASKQDKIQGRVGELLIELGIAEAMGRKMKELVREEALMIEFPVTVVLLACMWNYTDTNRRFSTVLRDVGVLEACQEVIRDPVYKDHLEEEKKNQIVMSIISILLNSAQCEANHPTLNNLRVLNDLLQFTKSKDSKIKSVATLAMSFLIREENAHLVRSSSKSGVIHFLLEKLEATTFMDDHRADGFSSTELLGGLLRVTLNDANKVILVYDGILPILSHLLEKGNPEEKQLAIDMVWSLTFQEDNKYCIQVEQRLVDSLDDLVERGEGQLKVKAKGALCQMEITRDRIYRILERQSQGENMDNNSESERGIDVYLSHHPKSQPLFSQLQNQLKLEGFSVMSVNHDSTEDDLFDLMTSSVERSKVVVMEISRQYQQSLFCRTESEYAHSLLKPLISVRTEHGFKPSNWLAKVSIGRPYVDCTRGIGGNELEARMGDLLREVKHGMRQGQGKE